MFQFFRAATLKYSGMGEGIQLLEYRGQFTLVETILVDIKNQANSPDLDHGTLLFYTAGGYVYASTRTLLGLPSVR